MAKVSIVVLTLNEATNLPDCLKSIEWCDDVVVIDSYSSDATVEIAEAWGARVIQRKFDSFAGQRNFALRNVSFRHDWVLHLDADEQCTDDLRREIESQTTTTDLCAFRIPSQMMFMGRWLKYAGMYPTYQVRLGRQPEFRFRQVGHGQREDVDDSRIGTLSSPYLHFSFSKGLAEWFEKHNRYSTQEATAATQSISQSSVDVAGLLSIRDRTRRRRALKQLSFRLYGRPTLRFLYMYFLRLGFLDGAAGYRYCRLLAIYEEITDMKIAEQQQRPVRQLAFSNRKPGWDPLPAERKAA